MIQTLFPLWLFLPLLVIWLFIAAENELIVSGLIVTIAAVWMYDAYGNGNIYGWIRENWKAVVVCAALYPFIGGGWSVYRWYAHNVERSRAMHKYVASDQAQLDYNRWTWKDQKQVPYDGTFEEFVEKEVRPQYRPRVAHHKYRLTAWIVYWPFDAVWYVVSDWLLQIFNRVYESLVQTYERITDRVFK